MPDMTTLSYDVAVSATIKTIGSNRVRTIGGIGTRGANGVIEAIEAKGAIGVTNACCADVEKTEML